MRALMVCPDLPAPPTSGGRVRMFHLLRELRRRHEIDVLAPCLPEPESLEASRAVCRHLWVFPVAPESAGERWSRQARSLLVGRLHHPRAEVQAALARALETRPYDILHLVTPYLVPSLPRAARRPPVVVDFLGTSLGAWRDVRLAPRLGARLRGMARWSAAVRGERWVLRRVDAAFAISETDRQYLQRLAPTRRIHVVPSGVDTGYFAPQPEREEDRRLAFVGDMSFPPNVDGARYLARTILPRLRSRVPGVRVWLVGQHPTPEVLALAADPAITVTGAVPDVRPYVARAAVVVIPLRGGSGVRNKTLEAMAMGRPIVTMAMGVEGLDVIPGTELIVTDDPDAFAGAVADLLGSPARRAAMGKAARDRVEATYRWEASVRRVEAVYAELATRREGRPGPGTDPDRAA